MTLPGSPDDTEDPRFHVVCLHPEIPQNTGNIGRICVALGFRLHLVHPLGFQTDEKAVRRAGIDHWKSVDLVEHPDEGSFLQWLGHRRCHLFSSHGGRLYTQVEYHHGDVLIFGRESVGLSPWLLEQEGAFRLPMPGGIRSMNLANVVTVVGYEALRAIEPQWFR